MGTLNQTGRRSVGVTVWCPNVFSASHDTYAYRISFMYMRNTIRQLSSEGLDNNCTKFRVNLTH